MDPKRRVLFICTANAARSQLAEALLRHMAFEDFEAFAGARNPVRLTNGPWRS